MNYNGYNSQLMAGLMANNQQNGMKRNMYRNYVMGNLADMPPAPIVKSNPPIYDLTRVFLEKKQTIFNYSKQLPNIIVKRASFHVGIAYLIYLNKLEENGIDITDVEIVDPTRQSREIKQKDRLYKKNTKARGQK